jgi:6-phosphofructokinase 1
MGHYAVEQLLAGQTNQVVCYRDSHILLTPIDEALEMKKNLDGYMYRVAGDIAL